MSGNIFLRDLSFYTRDLNPIQQYVDQSAYYVSKVKNVPVEVAKQAIVGKMKSKGFENQRDPIVQFYERHNYEDREITYRPLSEFLAGITTENLTMAPSLTCYVNASEKESLLSGFTDENVKLRNVAKKAAAKFKAQGDMDKFRHYNGEQENKKLYNNSLSGAFSSGGSIVRNPSAHSTLTSTTRTMTSIGNASNERLIMGNRHYRDPNVTLNNVVTLAQMANKEEIRSTIQRFGLVIPTVDDVMNCLDYSIQLYWRDKYQRGRILAFVETLDDEERAAVVYTGDFYQLRQLNPQFVREFITQMSKKVVGVSVENPIDVIKKTDEMYVNYVHQICLSEVKGIGKDYEAISVEKQCIVAATCLNLQKVLIENAELIQTFFLTRNLPPSVAYIRDSIRRSVVLSDTDSTMFSCDEWVQWYFGDKAASIPTPVSPELAMARAIEKIPGDSEYVAVPMSTVLAEMDPIDEAFNALNGLNFTDEAYAVSGAVMFMATQCIAHSLALYSANLNVEKKKLFMASMKPEFVFPIFSLTSAGKHYYTYVLVKEGSVYSKLETEIKGVHLKSSASPKPIVKDVKKMMESILDTPMKGEKISLSYWIGHVAGVEREIKRSVLAGETTYLGRLNIKSPDAYKVAPEKSNYRHHLFWEEVFAPKYGHAPTPTYAAVKFPTTLCNRTTLAAWVAQIQDRELADRLQAYIVRNGRTDMNTIYVAQDYIEGYGVPAEIKAAIAIEDLVIEHLKSHRLILESLGFFSKMELNLTQQGY